MKRRLIIIVLNLFVCIFSAQYSWSDDKLNVEILVAGGWGTKPGEFGIEKEGKTELGYALDLFVTNDNIYILDSINDRIQKYDNKGRFINQVKFKSKWFVAGLPWHFTMLNNDLYMLIGVAPYYSPTGINEITHVSSNGTTIRSFGSNLIPKNTEEFYNSIFSDVNNKNIYCGLGGYQVLSYNSEGMLNDKLYTAKHGEVVNLVGLSPDGKLLITISKSGGKSRHTLLLNPSSRKIEADIVGRFTLTNGRGMFANVHTLRGTKRKNNLTTTVVELNDSINGKTKQIELNGDIRSSIDGREKIYKTNGAFVEKTRMDSKGNIYHLLASEDGAVLRRISISKLTE